MSLNKLTSNEKKVLIEKLKNFPVLEYDEEQKVNKNQFLHEKFPYGRIIPKPEYPFTQKDRSDTFIIDNEVNLCLSVKYGICSCVMRKYCSLYKRFEKLKSQDGNLYIKIFVPIYRFNLSLFGIARIIDFQPEKTFRFWKFSHENKYHYGIIKVQYVALGQLTNVDFSLQMNENEFKSITNSPFNFKWFQISDEFEEHSRNSLISMIEENKIQDHEKKLREKSRQLLEEVEQTMMST